MRAHAVLGVVSAAALCSAAPAGGSSQPPALVTGADVGGGAHVRGWTAEGAKLPIGLFAYSGNTGGARVATADVDGDGRPEILVTPGGPGSEVRIFDGRTYELRHRFVPYGAWGSGVYVAGADMTGDGKAEVVAATGPGCCTSARIYDPLAPRELAGFFLFGSQSTSGARVAAADFTGDGRAELAVLPAAGSENTRVGLYGLNGGGTPFRTIQAFSGSLNTELAAGDVTGDGRAELVVSAVGAAGGQVNILDATTGGVSGSFFPYNAAPPSIGVAVGDVDGDGRRDVVTAGHTAEGLHVRAFDATGRSVASFFALDADLVPRVSLAAADLDGNGRAEIVIGTGPTFGAPRVAVFDGTGRVLGGFSYDEPFFSGGVRVALGDVVGDDDPEIVTAPGPGRAPEIRLYDHDWDALRNPLRSFLAFPASFAGGVYVAAADLDGDRRPEIVAAPGPGFEPRVKVFAGDGRELGSFLAFEASYLGGVRVAAGDTNADGKAEIVAARASGPPQIAVFSATGEHRLALVPFAGSSGLELGLADLAGDGRAEILAAVASVSDPAGVRVFDSGTGRLIRELPVGGGGRPIGVDVDGDGWDEIALAHAQGRFREVELLDYAGGRIGGFLPYPWFGGGVFLARAVPVGPALAVDSRSLQVVEGPPLRLIVANLRDASGGSTPTGFAATISWGDGTESTGTIESRGRGEFSVVGAHPPLAPGVYRVGVTVREATGRTVKTTSVVRVANAPIRVTPAAVTTRANRRFRAVVARLRDGNPTSTAADFVVTIDWGDGRRSVGRLVRRGRAFEITGVHVYHRRGRLRLSVRVVEPEGRVTVVRSVAFVR
jgi:VCBS repeat protein